ncbi:hypothetical protein B9T07_10845 [Limnospira fusiformis CCALA 023]|jgi:hypothetical protein|nr:hypothetical protein AP285_15205 [Arthrospira platensis YZ]KDR55099.1 hypothetical protein APPUASWS_025170 [Arthrospira platensis str. Paraca]TVU51857.1 MAG: hypothetical protein EA414_20590 [Arthrospira sp. PLM2.Bin9]
MIKSVDFRSNAMVGNDRYKNFVLESAAYRPNYRKIQHLFLPPPIRDSRLDWVCTVYEPLKIVAGKIL